MALLSSKKSRFGWLKSIRQDLLFSRGIMLIIVWFAYRMSEWAMAYSGTVLAIAKPEELGAALQSASLVIGSVGVLPIALLTWGLNAYNQMRANQPVMVEDRRKAEDK